MTFFHYSRGLFHSIIVTFLLLFKCNRLMMAVLLKHHDLGHVALGLVDHGLVDLGHVHGLPRSIAEVCKVVHHSKRTLIKVSSSSLKPIVLLWHRT